MAVNEVGSVIIDSRSVPYSRGQSSEAIPRKNASRTICNSSFDVHFENRARVGLLAVKAVVNSISSRVMVTLPGKGPHEVESMVRGTTYFRLASRQNKLHSYYSTLATKHWLDDARRSTLYYNT